LFTEPRASELCSPLRWLERAPSRWAGWGRIDAPWV
jgi:hypothetical protein